MNPVQYRIIKVPEDRSWVLEHDPDHFQLKAQVLLSGESEYQDFVHPLRGGPDYDGSLERLIHRDVHDIYPDATCDE